MSLMHILLALSLGGQQPATLSTELLTRGLPVPRDAAVLEKPITSYAVLDDERGFVIGYYTAEPDGMLHELHIRVFDKSTQTWRDRTFSEPIGSVLSIRRGGRTIYVAGHSSPSAAPLLVLSEALDMKRTLDGWPMLVMRDGRVMFQRSMIHFAPAHAAALAVYDPASDRETPVYPPGSVKNERGGERVGDLWMDRSVGTVTEIAPSRIQFEAVEQLMRLDATQRAEPASPERSLTVTCDLSTHTPQCAIGDSR